MSGTARSLGPRITRQVLKLRDRQLLEGAMATSALVAMADRRLLIQESLALGSVLENAERLRIYDADLAVSLYGQFVETLRNDFDTGRREALEVIGRCANDLEAAELLVKVGIAIAKADDDFSPEEVEMVGEICQSLGISGLDPLMMTGEIRQQPPH